MQIVKKEKKNVKLKYFIGMPKDERTIARKYLRFFAI